MRLLKVKGVKVTRKVKIVKRKFCIKKTHVYNNCYELRSRAINNVCDICSVGEYLVSTQFGTREVLLKVRDQVVDVVNYEE